MVAMRCALPAVCPPISCDNGLGKHLGGFPSNPSNFEPVENMRVVSHKIHTNFEQVENMRVVSHRIHTNFEPVRNMGVVSHEAHTNFEPVPKAIPPCVCDLFFVCCFVKPPASHLSEDIHRNHCPPRAAESRPSQNLGNFGDGFQKNWIT